jgi:hypothetical protein
MYRRQHRTLLDKIVLDMYFPFFSIYTIFIQTFFNIKMETYSRQKLLKLAKERGFGGVSRLTKPKLVKLLQTDSPRPIYRDVSGQASFPSAKFSQRMSRSRSRSLSRQVSKSRSKSPNKRRRNKFPREVNVYVTNNCPDTYPQYPHYEQMRNGNFAPLERHFESNEAGSNSVYNSSQPLSVQSKSSLRSNASSLRSSAPSSAYRSALTSQRSYGFPRLGSAESQGFGRYF